MNILIIYSQEINPLLGGVERSTSVLSEFFKFQGENVYFICFDKIQGTNPNQFKIPLENDLFSIQNKLFITKIIHEKKIDIILNQDGKNVKVCQFLFQLNLGNINVITVIHNTVISRAPFLQNSKTIKFLFAQLYRRKYKRHYQLIYKKSRKVITLSEAYKKDLIFIIGHNREDKIFVLNNPSNMGASSLMSKKTNTAIYVGRLDVHQKRLDLLLKAWAIVEGHNLNWKLILIGDGPDSTFLKNLKDTLGLNYCEFAGRTSPEKFYSTSSIFCLTSAYEGQPMSIIEAMQFGVIPVVMNSFSAAEELVSDGENGYLVKFRDVSGYSDALVSLMKLNKEERIKLSKSAKISTEKFQPKICGEIWHKLLLESK